MSKNGKRPKIELIKKRVNPPMFISMPSRETMHRMVIKSCEFENVKDMKEF